MPADLPADSAPQRVSLADPALPVDPEHAARLLGEALRRRHDQPTDADTGTGPGTGAEGSNGRGLPSWPLTRLAEHVARAADDGGARGASPESGTTVAATMPDGPYVGRRVDQLATTLVETATALAATGLADGDGRDGDGREVTITLGLGLDVCFVEPSGVVVVDPAGVVPSARGDRHVDVAAAAVGLSERFGPAVVVPMIEAYGFELIDARRLDTAQLLVAVAEVVGWPAPDGEES